MFFCGEKGERPCKREMGGRGRGKRNPRDEGNRGGGQTAMKRPLRHD